MNYQVAGYVVRKQDGWLGFGNKRHADLCEALVFAVREEAERACSAPEDQVKAFRSLSGSFHPRTTCGFGGE